MPERNIKRNIAPDKFHLHFHGMIMRAVKNGYFLQRHTAANQFRNPLRHKNPPVSARFERKP